MRVPPKLFLGTGMLVSVVIIWEGRIHANHGPLANTGIENIFYNVTCAISILLLFMGFWEFIEQQLVARDHVRDNAQPSTPADLTNEAKQQTQKSTEEKRSVSNYRAQALIEVDDGATLEEIKSHWRRTCKQWHPDYGGSHDVWIKKKRAFDMLVAWGEYTSDSD